MSKAAMQQALEALEAETSESWECNSYHPKIQPAMTALKQALAEPEQEPVAWMESPHGAIRANPHYPFKAPASVAPWNIPLYMHPPTPRKPDLETLNAELVEALRKCDEAMAWDVGGEPMDTMMVNARNAARAALAKVGASK